MSKLLSLVMALALAFFAWPGSASAEEDKVLTFAIEPNWPPLEFADSDGQIKGYSVDYFKAVSAESGYKANFVKIDWDNLFTGLDAGQYDAVVSSVTITPERRKAMDFSIPYFIVRQSLVVPENSTLTNIRQLSGLKVGTQVDSTATALVNRLPGVQSVEFTSIEEAISALATGELDAVVCENVVADNFVIHPGYQGKIKVASIIHTLGAEELYGAAVKKGNYDVLVALNEGIKAVKEKGIEKELVSKWLKSAK